MDYMNEIITLLVKAASLGFLALFSSVVLPWLQNQSFFWIVKVAAKAAEKLGSTGEIPKAKKKEWVIDLLTRWGYKVDEKTEVFIEAVLTDLDAAAKEALSKVSEG